MTSHRPSDYKHRQQLKHPRRYAPIHPEHLARFTRNTWALSFGITGRFPSEQEGGIVGIRIQEQEKWLDFWHDVLACELAPMRVFDERGNVVERFEAEEHIPPLDNFSGTFISLIFQLPTDTGAHFWQPMLDLGFPGQLWLEWLLTDFLTEGLYNQPRGVFMHLWANMIAYASSSRAWKYADETRFEWQSLWAHLLGFAHSESHLWEAPHADVVQAMTGIYQSLVLPNLNDARWAAPFIAWLKRPAAAPLRARALAWLSPLAQQADRFWWGENHLEQNLAPFFGTSLRFA